MMNKSLAIAFLGISAAVFVLSILLLFSLRFQAGDVYPEYSSLRSDPLGTMALYESLEKSSGLKARRDLAATNQLPEGAGTTYFHIAAPLGDLQIPENMFNEIQRFAGSGGRFVITMYPWGAKPLWLSDDPKESSKTKASTQRERWGVNYEFLDLDAAQYGSVYQPATVHTAGALPLPETMNWHSGVVFKNLGPDWKPIYLRGDKPVMIERTIGHGSVVIATDSYFLSNEALLLDRHSDLLAFLIGPNRNLVFDEAHFGIIERPGMASLIRRYRLHWVVASLMLVAILFIWKVSMPLLPLQTADPDPDYIAGKDTYAGIVNLLRRSIPSNDLFATCFKEWKKSAAHAGGYAISRLRHAEAEFEKENSGAARTQEDTVRLYRAISRILQRQSQ